MKEKTKKFLKKHLGWTICGGLLLLVSFFMLIINLIPPKKNVVNNPFVVAEGELPMIAAHRGGGDNNPENTMMAFRKAVTEYGVEIIESDLWLTSDNKLVYNHDSTIKRTCDAEAKGATEFTISNLTLAQLEQYNFGYNFYIEDEDDNIIYPYRGLSHDEVVAKGLQIATVDKLFEEFYNTNPDLLFIVEIKNGGTRGETACKILWETLEQKYPDYIDNIVVGTFKDEIGDVLKTQYPRLLRGAPEGAATEFVVTQLLGVNLFSQSDFACLQIPNEKGPLKLDLKTLINRAHQKNIAVQYWTINNPDEMRKLIELGCDCIMTDNPELLKSVLDEYRK